MRGPVLLLVGLALAGCSAPAESAPSAHRGTVVYEVGGDISFASYDDNLETGIQYPPGVTRVEITGADVPQAPKFLYTWANTSEGRQSSAWCRITVDGQVVEEQKATGEANDPMCFYPPLPS